MPVAGRRGLSNPSSILDTFHQHASRDIRQADRYMSLCWDWGFGLGIETWELLVIGMDIIPQWKGAERGEWDPGIGLETPP